MPPAKALWGALALLLQAGCTADPAPPPQTVAIAPAVAPSPPVAAAPLPPGTLATPAPGLEVPPTSGIAGTTLPPPAPAKRLGPTEVTTLLTGNTATGIASSGRRYAAYFAPNGTLMVRLSTGELSGGTWRVVADGRLCSILNADPAREQCYAIQQAGPAFRYGAADGAPVGSFAVTPGNPQSL